MSLGLNLSLSPPYPLGLLLEWIFPFSLRSVPAFVTDSGSREHLLVYRHASFGMHAAAANA